MREANTPPTPNTVYGPVTCVNYNPATQIIRYTLNNPRNVRSTESVFECHLNIWDIISASKQQQNAWETVSEVKAARAQDYQAKKLTK